MDDHVGLYHIEHAWGKYRSLQYFRLDRIA